MYGLLTPLFHSLSIVLTPFGLSFVGMLIIPWGIIMLKRFFS